jgi:hypothetical protein
MYWRSLSRDRRDGLIRRLDRLAAWSNPVLMIVAAYLLLADLSWFAALELSRLPALQSDLRGGGLEMAMPAGIGAGLPSATAPRR